MVAYENRKYARQIQMQPTVKELGVDQATMNEALQMIADHKPSRPRKAMPFYPDLSVEGEKVMRAKPGGAAYWWMPFRRRDFVDSCNHDG